MKIQSIQSYNSTKNSQPKSNYLSSSMTNSSNGKDSYSPSFGIGSGLAISERIIAAKNRIRILERTPLEMVDLAESFHKCSQDKIILLCETRKEAWGEAFFKTLTRGGVLDIPATEKKYDRFTNAIKEVIEKKSRSNSTEIKRLDDKADRCPIEYDFEYLFRLIWEPEYKPKGR